MSTNIPSPGDDLIDSRDVVAAIEMYESWDMWTIAYDSDDDAAVFWSNEDGWVDRDSADTFTDPDHRILNLPDGGRWELLGECEADYEELTSLRALLNEMSNYSDEDVRFGVLAIYDGHFEAYAEELADDIGAIDAKAAWPLRHIDWKAAARELQQDYTEIEWEGCTYWVR